MRSVQFRIYSVIWGMLTANTLCILLLRLWLLFYDGMNTLNTLIQYEQDVTYVIETPVLYPVYAVNNRLSVQGSVRQPVGISALGANLNNSKRRIL